MTTHKKSLLLLALLSAAALPTLAADPPAAPASTWTQADAAHLLRRAAFSGTPEQQKKLLALGKTAAVDYLLTGTLPPGTPPEAAPFPPVKLEPLHLEEAPAGAKPAVQKKKGAQDMREQWLDRMVRTDRPLEEKMSLFWHGLFTSGIGEVKAPGQMLAQNNLFHTHALGNYKTLTLAIVHDSAMLKYLNNNENVKGKPNENLARELCELFTMGEGKGYTEKDVGEIARALTGATVQGKDKNAQGNYIFRASTHDDAPKTIFGKTGNYKPDDVIGLIFDRPEPAAHLARRLWEFFVYPDPSEEDLAPLAQVLRVNHYEVAPALKYLFTSDAFYSEKAKFSLIKSPPELVVGTMRVLGQTPESETEKRALAAAVGLMGQQLFQPPNVRGWPGGETWITAATLFERYNVASSLVDDNLRPQGGGRGKGPAKNNPPRKQDTRDGPQAASARKLFPDLSEKPTPAALVDAAIDRFLQRPLHPEKRKILLDALGDQSLHLGTPDTESRIRQMLGLLLSTPEYQVE